MWFRFTLASFALLLAIAPARAEPPQPTIVGQAKPISRLLTEFREMIRQTAGPTEAERLVKEFDQSLKDGFGERGFEGLDLNRPLGMYAVLGEQIEDTRVVVVVPTTGEKEFIALLERIRIKAEPVKDKKGVYKLVLPNEGLFPKESHLQFAPGGWAYIALNEGEPTNPKDLVAPNTLFDNADPALATLKLFPGRVPAKLLANALEQLDNAAAGIKGFIGGGVPPHVGKMMTTLFDEGPKLIRRYAETAVKEAAEVALRFGWDQASGDTVTELTLVPKAGTPLAKELAGFAAPVNRFAGLVPKDAAVGVVVKVPLYAKELQEIVAAVIEAIRVELKEPDALQEAFHPVADEVAKSLTGSVKKGSFDVAFALVGPSKDGKFTVVVGMSLDDAAAVEKALRQAAKAANLAKVVQFDAAKVGAVNVHKVSLAMAFPEDARADLAKVFGENPPGHFAFDKDAVFLAVGPDSLAALKTAIEAKPAPAPIIEVTGNMKRLHKFVELVGDERAAGLFAKHLGTDDKAASVFRVTAEGGPKLTVKITLNLRYIPRAFMIAEAVEGNVKPPLPPVDK